MLVPAVPVIRAGIIFICRTKIDRSFGVVDENPSPLHLLEQLIAFQEVCIVVRIE